jgi:hypothetical protein
VDVKREIQYYCPQETGIYVLSIGLEVGGQA